MDGEDGPPRKIAATGYRYCSHCDQTVSKRTYRKHMALPIAFTEGSTSRVTDTSVVDEQSSISRASSEHLEGAGASVIEVDPSEGQDSMLEGSEDTNVNEDSNSSSSEYESDNDEETSSKQTSISTPPLRETNQKVYSLVRWFVIFIRLWQALFTISDAAIELLLKFLSAFLQVLVSLIHSPLLRELVAFIPGTLYRLNKYLDSDTTRGLFTSYVVCPACFTLYMLEDCFSVNEVGERVPKKCSYVQYPNHPQRSYRLPCSTSLFTKISMSGGKTKYVPRYTYAYQSLKHSLQRLLYRPGFTELLEHWRKRQSKEDCMSDVYDGKVWNDFNSEKYSNFLRNKRCYGAMLNFDFFQPYKHTPESYGVFYITLLNLPRDQRFKQENVLLVGIIPAFEHEPPLNPFMLPLVQELQEFWNPGVRLFTAESPRFKLQFRLALMCVACDIPAARKVCGFMGHSANLGCSRCLKRFPSLSDKKRDCSGFDRESWPSRDLNSHKRTCQRLKKCKSSNESGILESQSGIRYSVLIELPYFDPIRFTVVDPMHNLFLGTAKRVMKKIWIEKDLISKDNMKVIQTRVDSMRVPSDIGRIPRKIASSFGGFTAEQWKNWVIVYSMFALRGILPQEHYSCWQAFVLSCYFLCRKEIQDVELKKADLLLLKFCKKVESLYGNRAITPNMHLHCHIAECVKDFGPIYGFWLFSFERYNGILGSYPTNKRNTTEQIMRRFLREVDDFRLELPEMYKEHFYKIMPLHKNATLLHEQQLLSTLDPATTLDMQFIVFPSFSRFASLTARDYDNLKTVYSFLSDSSIDDEMVRTIRIFKTITLFNQHFGSFRSPSTKNSAYIMASWAKQDGSIGIEAATTLRPGKVLYYFTHQCTTDGSYKQHVFAAVYWYSEHFCRSMYGKPLEIWKDEHIPEGPAMFLPIHKLECRCVAAHSTIPVPSIGMSRDENDAIRLPGGAEERVIFVSPLPGLKFC